MLLYHMGADIDPEAKKMMGRAIMYASQGKENEAEDAFIEIGEKVKAISMIDMNRFSEEYGPERAKHALLENPGKFRAASEVQAPGL